MYERTTLIPLLTASLVLAISPSLASAGAPPSGPATVHPGLSKLGEQAVEVERARVHRQLPPGCGCGHRSCGRSQ